MKKIFYFTALCLMMAASAWAGPVKEFMKIPLSFNEEQFKSALEEKGWTVEVADDVEDTDWLNPRKSLDSYSVPKGRLLVTGKAYGGKTVGNGVGMIRITFYKDMVHDIFIDYGYNVPGEPHTKDVMWALIREYFRYNPDSNGIYWNNNGDYGVNTGTTILIGNKWRDGDYNKACRELRYKIDDKRYKSRKTVNSDEL